MENEIFEILSKYPVNKFHTNKGTMEVAIEIAKRIDVLKAESEKEPTELESIKYIKKIEELINLGDTINIKARLIHLKRHIMEDFKKFSLLKESETVTSDRTELHHCDLQQVMQVGEVNPLRCEYHNGMQCRHEKFKGARCCDKAPINCPLRQLKDTITTRDLNEIDEAREERK